MKKRNRDGLAALPLALLPAVNAITSFVFRYFLHAQMSRETFVTIVVVSAVLSLVISGISAVLLFRVQRKKAAYMVIAAAFNALLIWILLK
jgi:hypothetical protein